MTLPTEAQARKSLPIVSGVLDYFPDALVEVARVSQVGNDQHNPGQPLHWDKSKSTDHADCLVRHLLERGLPDNDGTLHSAKVAWRALALLQTELDAVKGPIEGDIEDPGLTATEVMLRQEIEDRYLAHVATRLPAPEDALPVPREPGDVVAVKKGRPVRGSIHDRTATCQRIGCRPVEEFTASELYSDTSSSDAGPSGQGGLDG